MAKNFYSQDEAAQKLGKSVDELGGLVRDGKLREFRDAGSVNYKREDVDALAGDLTPLSGTGSGEILLEPAEDTGISLSGGSDILSLEEADAKEATAGGTRARELKKKEDSVVPSVGVNVFDDDDLDELVDPLAQTAITDVGGLGIDSAGSGSGIMDLSRESDDTSLGADLLGEIYGSDDEEGSAEAGEKTRAGLDEALAEGEGGEEEVFAVETAAQAQRVAPGVLVAAGPDPLASGLTAAVVVAIVVLWFAGLAGAGMVRGIVPSLLQTIYDNLPAFTGGGLGLAVLAAAATFFVAKRRG